MAKTFKPHELAQVLGIGVSTIRLWALREYGDYLSPAAAGGGGRARVFGDIDARVIAFIAASKQQGLHTHEIHTALGRMKADEWRDLPAMPPMSASVQGVDVIPREAADTALSTQRAALIREITVLTDRVQSLERELSTAREERADLQVELTAAREQLGELRGQLSERLPMRTVLIGVLIAAAVVVAVLLIILARGG